MCITYLFYRLSKFKEKTLFINKEILTVYIADSFLTQAVGLMYRKSLPKNKGMLFTTKHDSYYGIWMLNMLFKIDIIWIDSNNKVVDIKANAEPCGSVFHCKVFKPRKKAKYILEVNADYAKSKNIKIGTIIKIVNV